MEETVDKVKSDVGGVHYRKLKAVCFGRSRESLSQVSPPSVSGSADSLDVLSSADMLPFQVAGTQEIPEEQRLRFRFLDLGDLSGSPLFSLVCPRSLIGSIDVYLVPHHGGRDATYPAGIPTASAITTAPAAYRMELKSSIPNVLWENTLR